MAPDPQFNRYSLQLKIDRSEADGLIRAIKDLAPAGSDWRKPYFTEPDDPDLMVFKISGTQAPRFFDVHGRRLQNPVRIGAGSVVRVELAIVPYDNVSRGVALWPNAIQIVELVEAGGVPEHAGSGFQDRELWRFKGSFGFRG